MNEKAEQEQEQEREDHHAHVLSLIGGADAGGEESAAATLKIKDCMEHGAGACLNEGLIEDLVTERDEAVRHLEALLAAIDASGKILRPLCPICLSNIKVSDHAPTCPRQAAEVFAKSLKGGQST